MLADLYAESHPRPRAAAKSSSLTEKWILTAAIALLPVYVFRSGTIQPTHVALAIFATIVLLRRGIPNTNWGALLICLTAYTLLVEGLYTLQGQLAKGMIVPVYFLYNFAIASAVYEHCRRFGMSGITLGISLASAIALGSVLVSGVHLEQFAPGDRSTGTFNNPNQLGYFSVCLLSLAYLAYREKRVPPILALAMFGASLFLAIASLSKSAMLSNFAVIFFALKPASAKQYIVIWIVGTIVAATVLFILYQRGMFDHYLFIQRLDNMASENDSSPEARGYYALRSGNALQVLFGLGSQEVSRIVGHEVHSTLGSVLMSYGVVGLLLFAAVLTIWMWRLWKSYDMVGVICLAGPAMLYGIMHNGTRFATFWLLFAASLGMAARRHQAPVPQAGRSWNRVPVQPGAASQHPVED